MGAPVSDAVGVDLAQSDVDLCSVSDVCGPCVAPLLAIYIYIYLYLSLLCKLAGEPFFFSSIKRPACGFRDQLPLLFLSSGHFIFVLLPFGNHKSNR